MSNVDYTGQSGVADPNYIDARDLYNLMLQSFQTTAKTPQAAEKDRAAFQDQVVQQLGFNPLTYQPGQLTPYTPKQSAVRLQYGNDKVISSALDDIDKGDESSSTIAAKLINPADGTPTEAAVNAGITAAQATAAVSAAKDYEKEKAQNSVDQSLYEDRQKNDPTYGRTKSNAPNAGLPDGALGQAVPQFAYNQPLLDVINNMSDTPNMDNLTNSNPSTVIPGKPFIPGHASYVDTLEPGKFAFSGYDPVTGKPHVVPTTPAYKVTSQGQAATPDLNLDPLNMLRKAFPGAGQRTQLSDKARATQALAGAANVIQANLKPQETQANQAAVQRLLQVQAMLNGG